MLQISKKAIVDVAMAVSALRFLRSEERPRALTGDDEALLDSLLRSTLIGVAAELTPYCIDVDGPDAEGMMRLEMRGGIDTRALRVLVEEAITSHLLYMCFAGTKVDDFASCKYAQYFRAMADAKSLCRSGTDVTIRASWY